MKTVYGSDTIWYISDILFMITTMIACDFQFVYLYFSLKVYDRSIPHYRPLESFNLLRRFLRFVVRKIKELLKYLYNLATGQLKKAGNFTLAKAKILGAFLKKVALMIIEPLKRGAKGAAYYVSIMIEFMGKALKAIL